ncbi:MAG: transposase [Candidatus Eisenbacteria sp.]|nr:transposase [Candidatus Eisenbacteria bacterium]
MKQDTRGSQQLTIGLDLGDKHSHLCVLNSVGEVEEEGRVATTAVALQRRFNSYPRSRVAIEVGPHSPWVSRLLEACGHEVLVANPRRLRMIYQNDSKSDEVDAEMLARIARTDPKLLAPIQHRGVAAQSDLAIIRARDVLVRSRTQLVNHVRGAVKITPHGNSGSLTGSNSSSTTAKTTPRPVLSCSNCWNPLTGPHSFRMYSTTRASRPTSNARSRFTAQPE